MKATEEHILKFTPFDVPAAPRHAMPLWHDIYTFFKEQFAEYPFGNTTAYQTVIYYPDAQTLCDDLMVRFHCFYDLQHIQKMLQVEYKYVKGIGYEFLREDFYKEVSE